MIATKTKSAADAATLAPKILLRSGWAHKNIGDVGHTPGTLRHGRKGWIFDNIGLGDWLFDIDATPAATIAETVLSLHTENEIDRSRAADAMQRVRKRQQYTLDMIEQVLRNLIHKSTN